VTEEHAPPAATVPDGDEQTDRTAVVLLTEALAALQAADLPHCLRNGELRAPQHGDDVDVLVPQARVAEVGPALAPLGWQPVRAPGHRGHRFWVRTDSSGTWLKLDVVSQRRYGSTSESVDEVVARRRRVGGQWVVAEEDEARHRAERAAGNREIATWSERLRRALPVASRRRGVVVAMLGPDGAGKGTTIAAVAEGLPVAHTVVYLGDRRASSRDAVRNAGGASGSGSSAGEPARSAVSQREAPTGSVRVIKEVLFLLRKWALLQPDLFKAYWRAWGGHVVLCDRHPLDAVAVAPPRTRVGGHVERLLAERLTPRPDAVIVLDAPGEVLYARKHEHSPAILERWRQGYRALPGAEIVDTTVGVETAVATVSSVLWATLARRWEPR
jgi:thymidylate kinase